MTRDEQFDNLEKESSKVMKESPYNVWVDYAEDGETFIISVSRISLFRGSYNDCLSLLWKLKESLPLEEQIINEQSPYDRA